MLVAADALEQAGCKLDRAELEVQLARLVEGETEARMLWAVDAGSHDDYCILGVCETEEDAAQWAAFINESEDNWRDDPGVRRIVFVPRGVEPYNVTTWRYHVVLMDDGQMIGGTERSYTSNAIDRDLPPRPPTVRYVRAPCHEGRGGRLEVTGDDHEEVRRVAAVKIAAWKAGTWAGPAYNEIDEGFDEP